MKRRPRQAPRAERPAAAHTSNAFLELAAPGVRRLKPYQPGKPITELEREYGVSNTVKLASNENVLGPSPKVVAAMREVLADVWLYPDGGSFALKAALAERHEVPPAWITPGNGSNDVLVLLAEAFLTPASEAIYSRYAFAVYPLAVQAVGAVARVAGACPPEHDTPLGHDLEAMAALIGPSTRLIFVANPNNPTGTWVTADALQSLLERAPAHALVVVDEAYFDYVREPQYPDTTRWLSRYPNLVVTRTFSKAFGLAGLRVGYAVSRPEVAAILNRVRQPFNVNHLAQVGAVTALEDRDHLARSREMNTRGLRQLAAAFDELGLRYVPSVGNFLLVDLGRPAAPVYQALLREAVIVRPVGNYGLPEHVRITVGLPEHNERLIAALRKVL